MRTLMIAVYAALFWYALRAVLRWLVQRPPKAERRDAGLPPDAEMVRDPQCGVYVVKDRAVTKVIRGSILCFCGDDCAAAYEARGAP